jgi:hypothetical protein
MRRLSTLNHRHASLLAHRVGNGADFNANVGNARASSAKGVIARKAVVILQHNTLTCNGFRCATAETTPFPVASIRYAIRFWDLGGILNVRR